MSECGKKENSRVVIAAGGTGGHLFPAQALAHDLIQEGIEISFAGLGLTKNTYFQRDRFSFHEIQSGNIFRKGVFRKIGAFFSLLKGVVQSFKFLKRHSPQLIVGFGSYHTCPLLLAAWFKKIPYILFEPNSTPGKVNRLFSSRSVFNAVQFDEASEHLKGSTIEVEVPLRQREKTITKKEALTYFGLSEEGCTILVFGGSQGAHQINHLFSKFAAEILEKYPHSQVIHLTGNAEQTQKSLEIYKALSLKACVKDFEVDMSSAWIAADLVISRAGAMTIAEQINYEVPGILIPYPFASEKHQQKNASFMASQVKGAIDLSEDLAPHQLSRVLGYFLDSEKKGLYEMKEAIKVFKQKKIKPQLAALIKKELCSI